MGCLSSKTMCVPSHRYSNPFSFTHQSYIFPGCQACRKLNAGQQTNNGLVNGDNRHDIDTQGM